MRKFTYDLPYSCEAVQITGRPSNHRDDRMGLEEFEESGQALYDIISKHLPMGVLEPLYEKVIAHVFGDVCTLEKLEEIQKNLPYFSSSQIVRSWMVLRGGIEKAMEMKKWKQTEAETERMGEIPQTNSE